MTTLTRFLIYLLLFVFLFVLSQLSFLSANGIKPNLVMIGLLLMVFGNEKAGFTALVGVATIFLTFLLFPFWWWRFAVLVGLVLIIGRLRRFLTGKDFLDFLIAVLAGTLIFDFLTGLYDLSEIFRPDLVVRGMFYNFMVGIFGWLISRRLRSSRSF